MRKITAKAIYSNEIENITTLRRLNDIIVGDRDSKVLYQFMLEHNIPLNVELADLTAKISESEIFFQKKNNPTCKINFYNTNNHKVRNAERNNLENVSLLIIEEDIHDGILQISILY